MKRSVLVVLALAVLTPACDRGGEDGRILASGHVEATEVRLSTKVGGTLERLAVDEGSVIEEGQEIARIDPVNEVLALESARAERALARAELSLRLAGAREEDRIPLPVNDLFWRTEITLTSSYAAPQADSVAALNLIRSKRVPVNDMITHRLPLADSVQGFYLLTHPTEQDSMKIIIEPQK